MKKIYKLLFLIAALTGLFQQKASAQNSGLTFQYSTKCLTLTAWADGKQAFDSGAVVKFTVNGTIISGKQITYTASTSGTYQVCMKVINTAKKWDTSICKSITLKSCDSTICNLKPSFTWKNDCLKVRFIATSNQTGTTFTWTFGNGKFSSGSEVTHHFVKTGVYKVCVLATWKDPKTGTICKETICKEVKIQCGNPCNIQGGFSFKQSGGGMIKFSGFSNTGYHYEWNFGDGSTGKGKDAVHQYKKPGIYKVCVKITDKTKKCSVTICKTIEIKDPCNIRGEFTWRTTSTGEIQFMAASTNGAYYVWSFGDGTSATGKDPKHKYTAPGTYTVCLTIYSINKKCKITICKSITIPGKKCNWAAQKAGWGYGINCPKLTLEANNLNNPCIRYYWKVAPAGTNQYTNYHGRVQYLSNLANGTYNVCLVLYDTCNNCDTMICKSVTINCNNNSKCDWSKAGITYSLNCKTLTLEGNNLNNPCVKYEWQIAGVSFKGRTNTVTFSQNGSYTVCLKMIDTCNRCDTSICKTIAVNCSENKPCDWSKSTISYGKNCNKFIFEGPDFNDTACYSYAWSIDGNYKYDRVIDYAFSKNGTYTVCLKIKNNCKGCDTVICKTVVVDCFKTCSWNAAGFAYSVNCKKVTLEASNLNNGCIKYSFTNLNGVSYGSGRVVDYTFSQNGTYTVCLKLKDTCNNCDTTICKTIKIDCNPCSASAKFRVDSVSSSGKLYVTNLSTGGKYYKWSFDDSTYSYDKTPTKSYKYSGGYNVCLTVWDSLKTCSTTYCVSIKVLKTRSSGVQEKTSMPVRVYPNPASESITVDVEADATLTVTGLNGNIILNTGIAGGSTTIPTSQWAEGLYLVRITGAEASKTVRIVIAR